jgi:hypothetical protein
MREGRGKRGAVVYELPGQRQRAEGTKEWPMVNEGPCAASFPHPRCQRTAGRRNSASRNHEPVPLVASVP